MPGRFPGQRDPGQHFTLSFFLDINSPLPSIRFPIVTERIEYRLAGRDLEYKGNRVPFPPGSPYPRAREARASRYIEP